MQNSFGIVGVVDLGTNTQYVSTLLDVIVDIIVCAPICHLRHLDLLTCKLSIKIK